MAKETTIIFVYDTKRLQKEEDDPVSAILYFHPTWVSDQQKASLCGQIIGTVMCLKSIFTIPKQIHLQTGKFYIIENGRYILALGTDRNIADWLLEYRAHLLYSMVNFFNKDFETLSKLYPDEQAFSAKLYHIFESYLRMLFFGGNIFGHIPVLSLPKNASYAFTEAITFLETCREFPNVLGGSLLYHNKVVATQLTPAMTKKIVLADPYRIKSSAEKAQVDYELPLGLQLLQVYIPNGDFHNLLETSLRNRCIFQYLHNKNLKMEHSKKATLSDTPVISSMKRDQSLLFTAVPEEGPDGSTSQSATQFVPMIQQKKSRPKFLNLKTLSTDSNDFINQSTKNTPMTPFCGQTSVASTPMTELKRFVLQNPLTIVNKEFKDKEFPINKSPKNEFQNLTITPQNMFFFSVLKRSNSLIKLSDILSSIAKNDNQYLKLKTRLNLSPEKKKTLRRSKSINDPSFPVENKNGMCVSMFLFREQIKNESVNKTGKNGFSKSVTQAKKNEEIIVNKTGGIIDSNNSIISHKSSKEKRKSLSLPLKSANESKTKRKLSSGVQLTPLMSKLSILAFEERQNESITPMVTPSVAQNLSSNASKLLRESRKLRSDGEDNCTQKCVLLVCGQQDTVVELILREECCKDKETINQLWELCTKHILKIEKQLNFCLESQSAGPGGGTQECEPYSYLCLDSEWDTIKRGGPWDTCDLTSLFSLHRDFKDSPDVTEILVRNPDSVVYGYRCGPSEVFYHENAHVSSGVPPPSDPLGLAQTKAKRRLQRDHSIVLL